MVRVDLNSTFYNIDIYMWYSSSDGSILLQRLPPGSSSLYYDGDAMAVYEQRSIHAVLLEHPISSTLRFTLGDAEGPIDYRVIGPNGALITSGRIPGDPGAVRSIPMDGLSTGLYVLHLRTASDRCTSLRFIKE